MTDDIMARVAAANPVPELELTAEESARAQRSLERITGTERKPGRWLAAAAAAVLAVAVVVPVIGHQAPVATAVDVLQAAGEASANQPNATDTGVTNQEYLKRVDTDGTATVTTEYEVAGGHLRQDTASTGTLSPQLAALADGPAIALESLAAATTADALARLATDTYGSLGVGSLHLLLHPGLSSQQQRLVYENLAGAGGNELAHADRTGAPDEAVTVIRDEDQLSFTVLPSTGQLIHAHGLVGPGVTTTVEATAILGCVAVTGLEGPEDISLACADNNYLVTDLKWSRWGAETATATGTAFINDCDPFCAQGTMEEFPVTVTVRDLRTCGYNARLYSAVDVAFADPARNETFEVGCAPEVS
ncbi:hypothetical protein [Corynebacterium lizhenjunii]|uniref:hypothetical protein n=1 Tax=Corynebacterium lizhenjunii TaxID=2709394 RepID=UPI0013E9A88D|nr:hypothetical protein [Corynebacterium lizhenjunii]